MSEQQQIVTCEICRAPMVQELQDYVAEWDGEEVVVEDVPLWVCEQCGYTQVEDEVVEAVEDMLAHMDTVLTDEEE
ncbi:MAG TPA: YgiT-type zinc finger protein [Candidatus Sulfomarinibacteraceae bacterium]|nr:YgiT-type zinc finger protein [Candidatus Sulfomarinibacteraceae bacterium]